MVQTLLMDRVSTKTSLAVESSVMMRILSLPVSFFRRFSSGELSSRATAWAPCAKCCWTTCCPRA